MAITGTGYIKRSEFMVFADVSDSETPEWELIGDKIEDLSLAMNPNVETVTDITGATTTTLDKYEVQSSVSPMKAKRESKLAARLYDIVKYEKVLSDVEMNFLCVNVFDATGEGVYVAWVQKGVVAVQSFGGDTKGLDIPFNIHWIGKKTHGTFTAATKTFTEGENATQLVTFSIATAASARIAGAIITINNTIIVSDSNGIAEIRLPAGTYAYTISADGYETDSGSVTVSSAAVYKAVAMSDA